MFKSARLCLGVIVLCSLFGIRAHSQTATDWPNRPIKIVVPFAPTGTTDVAARIVAQKLQEDLGQSVVVENRVGASGMVGTDFVARAAPDGYTLVMGSSSTFGSVKVLFSKLTYDPVTDFVPVSMVATSQAFLVVNPSLPVNSVKELVDYLKKNPGKINYSSAGIGTFHHMSGALFGSMLGVQMTHVPYSGGGPGFNAVMAGQVEFMIVTWAEVGGYINSDKIKVLATVGKEKSPLKPDLPSITDVLPNYEVPLWVGLLAPSKTPPAVVEKINLAVKKAMANESVKKRLVDLGFNPVGNTSAEFASAIKSGLAQWPAIVRASGAKVE